MKPLRYIIPCIYLLFSSVTGESQCTCGGSGPNLVVNGDFSAGNTGFTSNFGYVSGCTGTYGSCTFTSTGGCNYANGNGSSYGVGNIATALYSGWPDYLDHTCGCCAGSFMGINGTSGTAGSQDTAWSEIINVSPNTNYTISFWDIILSYGGTNVNIQIVINGTDVGGPYNQTGQVPGTWTQYCQQWYSGSSTVAYLSLVDLTHSGGSNDCGLDDISMQTSVSSCTNKVALSSTNATCSGSNSGSATATMSGCTPPYTYMWTPSGETTSSATGLSAGTYTLTVINANACTVADTTVVISQSSSITTSFSVTNIVCNGTNTGSATVTPGGGVSPYTYSWSVGAQTNSTASGLGAGAYTVTVTDNTNCTTTASVTITSPPAIRDSTSVVNPLCGGGIGSATVGVKYGSTPYTYSWSGGSQTNATATGLAAGSYTVTVTDNNNCTTTASATLTAPPAIRDSASVVNPLCGGGTGSATVGVKYGISPYIYSWSPGSQTSITATGLTAGSYTVTVTDNNNCTATASATIATSSALRDSVSVVNPLCGGGTGSATAEVKGGTFPYTYSWSSGGQTNATITGLSVGSYTVSVTDNNGCSQSAAGTIIQLPSITATISSTGVGCNGNNSTATVTPNGGTPPYNYLWSPGGQVNATATGLSAGNYTVTITDATGCSASETVTIASQPIQTVVAFYSDISGGCSPLCIQFDNATSVNTGTPLSYMWSFGNGDSSYVENPIYCYQSGGNYSVELTVTTGNGCSSTLTKINMITVFSPPRAAFSISPQPTTILTPTIQFTDKSTDPYGIIQWWWTFGDLTDSVSTLQNPVHTYQDTGTYSARLVVTDANGCVDTAYNNLVIDPLFTLYIPDAFSPNGDGINDVFMAKGQYVKSFEMYIFDRWGEELFYSNNINNGWNGTAKGGSTCQEDTYLYKILATDYQNKQHTYIGNVTVIK